MYLPTVRKSVDTRYGRDGLRILGTSQVWRMIPEIHLPLGRWITWRARRNLKIFVGTSFQRIDRSSTRVSSVTEKNKIEIWESFPVPAWENLTEYLNECTSHLRSQCMSRTRGMYFAWSHRRQYLSQPKISLLLAPLWSHHFYRTNLYNTMYIIVLYTHIHAVKNTTICQMVSLCNIQHYVIYNYMFRPCKWAIIRLFVEPVSWIYNRNLEGGTRSRPPKLLFYSQLTGSMNNLMIDHLQGRNM